MVTAALDVMERVAARFDGAPLGMYCGGEIAMFDLIDLENLDPLANPWLDAAAMSGLEPLLSAWAPPSDYISDPAHWLDEVLGEFAWSTQLSVWESLVEHRSTAVHSCHDSGKSFIASRIIAWWIANHPVGEAFVVTTAPTAAQVAAILWREVGKAYRKAKERKQPLPGRIVQSPFSQWKVGDELVGYGRKPADYEQSAFQGIHAMFVLVVLDEAGGIVRSLWDAVDALLTNEHARVLAIGNPDDPTSHFATVCKPGSDWNVIRIDGLRTPNFTDEGTRDYPLVRALMEHEGIPYSTEEVPAGIRPLLLSPLWVEERLRRWCGIERDAHLTMSAPELREYVARRAAASPLFTAKVRGEFAEGSQTRVIPLGWAQRAVERWRDWEKGSRALPAVPDLNLPARPARPPRQEQPGRRVVGVDVAGEGDDQTAVAVRSGDIITEVHRYREADTMVTADYAAQHLAGRPHGVAVVDVIGLGAGVRDKLRRDGFNTVGFNAARQSDRADRFGEFKFVNDRAAAWWNLRQLLDPSRPGGSTVMLPDDEQLIRELTSPTYTFRTGKGVGRYQIEAKDEIRKRLGHSTDSADAVVQAFWVTTAVNPAGEDEQALPYADDDHQFEEPDVTGYSYGGGYGGVGGLPGDGWR